MKCNYLVYLFIIFFIAGSVFACSDENVVVTPDENESSYEHMGQLHNEGVDYVWKKLSEMTLSTKNRICDLPEKSVIRQMCSDFVCMKGRQIGTKNLNVLEDNPDKPGNLTLQQNEYLSHIKVIVDKAIPVDVQSFTDEMKSLEESVKGDETISECDKDLLLNVAAVCRYSAVYWAENYLKWQIEFKGVEAVVSVPKVRTSNENDILVSKEWWEKYKEIVWKDGAGGMEQGDIYVLKNAIVASVLTVLGM